MRGKKNRRRESPRVRGNLIMLREKSTHTYTLSVWHTCQSWDGERGTNKARRVSRRWCTGWTGIAHRENGSLTFAGRKRRRIRSRHVTRTRRVNATTLVNAGYTRKTSPSLHSRNSTKRDPGRGGWEVTNARRHHYLGLRDWCSSYPYYLRSHATLGRTKNWHDGRRSSSQSTTAMFIACASERIPFACVSCVSCVW